MKSALSRIAITFGFFAVSCIGGWYLGAFISRSSFWMPSWLFDAIHAAVQASGANKLNNEDDIETLGLFCLLAVSCAVVALVLGVASIVFARHVRSRR